ATVTSLSDHVSVSAESVVNDQIFWVQGGTETGPYEVIISHDLMPLCMDHARESAFKFMVLPAKEWEMSLNDI
ncbi:MAG: hypothetical protein ACNA7M_16055, partial [Roseovarius sp.]